MIDMKTVGFIGVLNRLAHESVKGIKPFSVADYDNSEGLFYDDDHPLSKDHKDGSVCYPLIMDHTVGLMEHDIISTYTDEYKFQGIDIYVAVTSDNERYVCVMSASDNVCIVVENGIWYDAK